jgi:hypothetical protein
MNRRHIAVVFTLLVVAFTARAQTQLPLEVSRFIEGRDMCEHFRGEEPYDAERGEFLAQKVSEFCTGTDKKLAALKLKYKANSLVQSKLLQYEVKIESSRGH